MLILEEYERILRTERRLWTKRIGSNLFDLPALYRAEDMYNLVQQLFIIGRSSLVPRGYIRPYGLDKRASLFVVDKDGQARAIVHESVGAHANFLLALVDRAIAVIYDADFGGLSNLCAVTLDGYSWREFNEVVRMHDLPENEIGDLLDNDSSDQEVKERLEDAFLAKYLALFSSEERFFAESVLRLFREMRDKSSLTGRLLYTADKTAAVLMTLVYDTLTDSDGVSLSPMRWGKDPANTKRDLVEMAICDFNKDGYYRASEMWTIDFFRARSLVDYDDSGGFLYGINHNGYIVFSRLLV